MKLLILSCLKPTNFLLIGCPLQTQSLNIAGETYLKWPYQVYPLFFFLLFRVEKSVWNWEFRAEPEILGLLADILKPLFESLVMTIATAMYITESSKSTTIPVLMTDNDGIPCSKSVWTGHKAEIEESQVQYANCMAGWDAYNTGSESPWAHALPDQRSGFLNKEQRRLSHWQEQRLVMKHFSRLQNM